MDLNLKHAMEKRMTKIQKVNRKNTQTKIKTGGF